ncbi:hypothetical protein SAMN04515618_101657 [Collimonas sp. OK307]|nr:hypothetical protein SAMN04515618_101657 [Collimonas sp. OK307]
MTIKLFATNNQQSRAANKSKGWIFGWTARQATTNVREIRSHDPRQHTPNYGIYGALTGNNGH